ncbi:DUF1015 family protein [Allosaccharopolyspora coralli]|uniref:DUF1015 family protein n=1 Tax=Allosaccharopolyspora coralli TaxID=2665642 RepID=A0A5Q3QF07_9PSEU|nr:DUF1015 domain-containing protein [Allosaccharopolyspora coralli]QGK70105.1 DUF1015 family protein [Allosaccharopolyspora coralli]
MRFTLRRRKRVADAVGDLPRARTSPEQLGHAGVEIQSFRGWHIAPNRVQDLTARYATPWNQHAAPGENSAAETANVLRAWQRSGTLVPDREPAMYVYQQTGPRGAQRGLLTAAHLDSRILPHETVRPERVEGITNLMRIGRCNLDPLLLGYSGGRRTTVTLSAVVREQRPIVDVLASDGQRHGLWRLDDRAAQLEIASELRSLSAFLADGHHRRLAARQYRRELYAAGYGPGPWDSVSALLVDVRQSPLTLGPVHRVLPYVDSRTALSRAARWFHVAQLTGPITHWVRALHESVPYGPAYLVVTPREVFLLTEPDPALREAALGHVAGPLRSMHATILDNAVMRSLWDVDDAEVDYEPSATRAVRQVREQGGVAVLLAAPGQTEIHRASSAGLQLPHRTAAFGPKPHPAMLLRTIER